MRILTWNAHGDVGSNAEQKAHELKMVIDQWKDQGDPVSIICLQEVNAERGSLTRLLSDLGWIYESYEERQGGGGADYVIAVGEELSIQDRGVIDLSPFRESIPSRPCRNPFCVDVDVPDFAQIRVATWHATLGSSQNEDIEGFSLCAAALKKTLPYAKIMIAADLNCDIGYFNDSGLFKGYTGWSHGLDHIISTCLDLSDGRNSESSSDHDMVSARFLW